MNICICNFYLDLFFCEMYIDRLMTGIENKKRIINMLDNSRKIINSATEIKNIKLYLSTNRYNLTIDNNFVTFRIELYI